MIVGITRVRNVEPSGMFCKHFGKCLSVEHWEETCSYYAGDGWPLYTWEQLMKEPTLWRRLVRAS